MRKVARSPSRAPKEGSEKTQYSAQYYRCVRKPRDMIPRLVKIEIKYEQISTMASAISAFSAPLSSGPGDLSSEDCRALDIISAQ